MMADHVLALDQGTTSTRAILFDRQGALVAEWRRELTQHYPTPGWVEHDPEEIWSTTIAVMREALGAIEAGRVAAIGITNQRETTLLWDRATGEPVYPAIVWQDRRTADACTRLRAEGVEEDVRAKTGLLLDPYFSATKLAWLLDELPVVRARAERGELAFGTVDCFLLWRLTGGRVHATDVTNASRTLLFDIHRGCWDEELCRLFGVPPAVLPEVRGNSELFGTTAAELFDQPLPIAGMAGDQQAALFGQACFEPGMAKSTYGTGCFLLLNTGDQAVRSEHRLLTTPAWRIDGRTTYALEGSIFVAGSAVKWLRDRMKLVDDAGATERLAREARDDHGLTLVPAFTGLGAPYWRPEARGALFGLTLDSGPAELVRAALEAVAFQTRDLTDAMAADCGQSLAALRVDGGMAANSWLCQFLADVLEVPIERPENVESTARGAAFHAGLATGVWSGLPDLHRTWSSRDRFECGMDGDRRAELLTNWREAVARTLWQGA
jgi:glycerol kinase